MRVTDAVGTIADASITVNAVLHLGTRSANVFSGNSLDLNAGGGLPPPEEFSVRLKPVEDLLPIPLA